MSAAAAALRAVLPVGWSISATTTPEGAPAWSLAGPDRRRATLGLAILADAAPRFLPSQAPARYTVAVAPFFSPAARARLEALGIGFVDPTGNIALSVATPSAVIQTMGASRAPRVAPNGYALKGPRAARLVRALLETTVPGSLSILVERAGLDMGYASRLLAWMTRESLVDRRARGPVTAVHVGPLLARWSEGYGVLVTHRLLASRDSHGAITADRLSSLPCRYAITGGLAAVRLSIPAPRRPALVYVEDADAGLNHLGLTSTSDDPDVILLEPGDPAVFDRCWQTGGLTYAAAGQIAIDLLTGPPEGRAFAGDVADWLTRRTRA